MIKWVRVILVLYIIVYFVASYDSIGTLNLYNAAYPYINQKVLTIIFKVLPYYLIIIAALIIFNLTVFRYLYFLLVFFMLFYHLKVFINQDCSLCAAAGFLPGYSYKHQLILYTIVLFSLIVDVVLSYSKQAATSSKET